MRINTLCEPILLTIPEAQRVAAIGRTTLYDLMGQGAIRSVKVGTRRLVVFASLRDWIASLGSEVAR